MANREHIQFLQPDLLRGARAAQPDLILDLSGVDLRTQSFENLDLHGANFSAANLQSTIFRGANLTGADLRAACLNHARFHHANLSGVDFSDADCTSADFSSADLRGAKATNKTILKSANFADAQLDAEFIRQADLAGVNLSNRDLSGIDLSDRVLNEANFERTILNRANFTKAKLRAANFSGAQLGLSMFAEAELTSAVLYRADMSGADLRGALLARANLMETHLANAVINAANFYEARLDGALLSGVRGGRLSVNLKTTRMPNEAALYFDSAVRDWAERLLDWEAIRVFGRLPLFGASYTGLIVIPAYVYFLGIYNDKIQAVRSWIDQALGTASGLPTATASKVLAHLHPEPIPDSFFLLFVSTLFLAIAATIYTFGCPSRVKHFTRDQWCDELGHSLVHYWPDAWKQRWLRLVCSALYVTGGAGALWVLGSKLWWVAVLLFRSEFT